MSVTFNEKFFSVSLKSQKGGKILVLENFQWGFGCLIDSIRTLEIHSLLQRLVLVSVQLSLLSGVGTGHTSRSTVFT